VRPVQWLRGGVRLPTEGFTREVRAAVTVDASAAVLFAVFAGLTAPFSGVILRKELGASPTHLAIVASAGAAFGLFSLLWARVLHGQPPLPYAVWPGFAARSLFLLVPLVQSPSGFVAVLVTGSLLGTIAEPAHAAVIQRLYPRELRGRAIGTVRMAGGVVVVVLTAAAGKLFAVVDYRVLFPIAALFGMGASLRQQWLPVPAEAGAGGERVHLREAWTTVRDEGGFRHLLVAQFVFGSGIWLMVPATPLLLVDVLGAGMAQIGLFAAIGGVAGLVGNFFWGRRVDGRATLSVLRTVYLIGALSPLVYLAATSPWLLAVTAVTEALMASGLDLVWTMCLMDAAGPRRTAQYVAISATLAGVRGVLCPLVSAVLIETVGVRAVYAVAAAVMLSAVWILSAAIRSSTAAASVITFAPRITLPARPASASPRPPAPARRALPAAPAASAAPVLSS
jgi:predicted MFS family arabinose efflux permease